MAKFNRFILPLALAKIFLVFLVLHFFFSSCSDDELSYSSDLYSDGPVLEIQASFGEGETLFHVGDTIYLDIALESLSLMDQLTGAEVVLSSAEFHTSFAFVNAEDEYVQPKSVIVMGEVDDVSESLYNVSFTNVTPSGLLMGSGSLPRLKIGFVFDEAGSYSFYFENTPNSYRNGKVDVYYDRNPDNEKEVEKAYAIYLFDLDEATHNYVDTYNTAFRLDILHSAGSDQSIVDFTIVNNN